MHVLENVSNLFLRLNYKIFETRGYAWYNLFIPRKLSPPKSFLIYWSLFCMQYAPTLKGIEPELFIPYL